MAPVPALETRVEPGDHPWIMTRGQKALHRQFGLAQVLSKPGRLPLETEALGTPRGRPV